MVEGFYLNKGVSLKDRRLIMAKYKRSKQELQEQWDAHKLDLFKNQLRSLMLEMSLKHEELQLVCGYCFTKQNNLNRCLSS